MKFKSAFTLGEVMIFFVVVSILLSILFVSIKPKQAVSNKSVKLKYAAAYDALNIAIYDILYKDETNPFVSSDGAPAGFRKLCTGLAEYINTDSVNCNTPLNQNVTYMKNENTDFKNLKPNLVSLTGMKFYISDLITDNTTIFDEYPDFKLQFFMVYVDLNGTDNSKRPHTIMYDTSGKTNPDVFAFAVIPTGEAIPMGIAEYNIKYLSTRVSYKDNKVIYYSPYYSYREAKHAAWNWYKNNGDYKFIKTLSFTYNDYIRNVLKRNNTQLYKFNQHNEFKNTYNSGLLQKCRPQSGTLLTSFDLCGITVDTPHFGTTN